MKETVNFHIPRIGVIVHEAALASSITLPAELAMAAAQASGMRSPRSAAVSLLSPSGGSIATSSGLSLQTDRIEDTSQLDLLVISAIWRNPLRVLAREPALAEQIQRLASQGTTIAAVGSGSFLLAETGLLNYQPATTHWHWFDDFEERYPLVDLRRDQLIVPAGNFYCAGSVNSLSDLLVYLLGNFYSPEVARHIENQFSPEIRRRFKATQVGTNLLHEHHDELVLDIQLFMQEKLDTSLTVKELAAQAGISQRTLNRRFIHATGVTPWQYLINLRIIEAESLLRRSNLSITDIAETVGFADAAHFARLFRRSVQLTPSDYRKAVRGKLFSDVTNRDRD